MRCTLLPDDTLDQYLKRLSKNRETIRPVQCPDCCKAGLWHHGSYQRYPDRKTAGHDSLNPVPILRFHLSSLSQDMLMSACVYCTQALVFMGFTTNSSDAGFEWLFPCPDQSIAPTGAAYDWALESVA